MMTRSNELIKACLTFRYNVLYFTDDGVNLEVKATINGTPQVREMFVSNVRNKKQLRANEGLILSSVLNALYENVDS